MIVATSHAVARLYTDVISADKLTVNYAGLDLVEFDNIDCRESRATLQAELGVADDEKIVVNASMIKFWKGQHIFIEAAAEALKQFPDTVFLIIGEAQFGKDKEYERQLSAQVDELNLAGRVKFLGFRRDVYRLVAAADCLVHCPVTSDPLPTIVLEAMAAETPVIGSCIGGIPEQVDHQKTGLLVEPDNAQALAQAVVQMLKNLERGKYFAQAAQKKLQQEFSLESFARKFEQIYDNLSGREVDLS